MTKSIVRGSTTQWMTGFQENKINHEKILLQFEERGGIEKNRKREGKPINILCFDGGGMRGYALVVMLEMMQKKAGKNLLDCFDLVGGTSVGGCGALVCNRSDTLETGCMLMRDVIDDVRENCFEGLKTSRNFVRLITEGSLLRKEQYIIETLKKRFPDEPLLNKNGIPTFVVTATKVDQKISGEVVEFEPFILRSYEYGHNNEKKDDIKKDIHSLADSTSSVLLCEAMAATSAVPPLVDRVTVNCDGKQISLGDGGVISASPVVHAFDEASRLYPDRPIGVVLSFGFTNDQDAHVSRAVDVMRMSSPNLHFQRIAPHEIMDPFKSEESDLTKIALMELRVQDYMLNTARVVNALDITIGRLVQSRLAPKRNTPPLNSLKVFKDMYKSTRFENRQNYRRASAAIYKSRSKLENINDIDDTGLDSSGEDFPRDTSSIQPIVDTGGKHIPVPENTREISGLTCRCVVC